MGIDLASRNYSIRQYGQEYGLKYATVTNNSPKSSAQDNQSLCVLQPEFLFQVNNKGWYVRG